MKGFARTSGLSLVAAVIMIMVSPVSAFAHSAIISSDPKKDSTLNAFPTTLTVVFNEELLILGGSSSNYLELRSLSGESIQLGESRVEGKRLIASVLSTDAPLGRFIIAYRAVSGDGHVIEGEIGFSYLPNVSKEQLSGDQTSIDEGISPLDRKVPAEVIVVLISTAVLITVLIFRASKHEEMD